MKLISIGFGSTVCAERILAVIAPESAPIKRLIQEARERGMLIDASFGRKTKSVLLMDTDHVILASVSPEILSARDGGETGTGGARSMKGKLFVVSGPSGVGKNTLLNAVIDRSENVRYSVSATSAPFAPARSTVRATILSRASDLKRSLPTTRCSNTPSTSETITARRSPRFEKPSPTALTL